MKTALGLLVLAAVIALGWQLGNPGKRLYERPGAYGDRK